MRRAGISIAKYNEKENKIEERIIEEDNYWSPKMEKFFYENIDLPIYGWYSDNYQAKVIIESKNYRKEWSKIKD